MPTVGAEGLDFPRMQPPDKIDEDTQAFLSTTKFFREGRPLNSHQVFSNHPRAARALNRFLDWGDEAVLSSRERRMLVLRTSMRANCPYEWGVHSQQAIRTGDLDAPELEMLGEESLQECSWSERELALLRTADNVCETDTLSDSQWKAVAAALDSPDIIEALIVIGYYRMCAGLINAVGVPEEGDLSQTGPDGDRTESDPSLRAEESRTEMEKTK
jgi:4-carboxymuconolactone decarboxylase